jgi:hypothetical protein
MTHPAFLAGDLHTGFLVEHPELLAATGDPWLQEIAILAASVAHFRHLEQLSLRGGTAAAPPRVSGWKRAARAGSVR